MQPMSNVRRYNNISHLPVMIDPHSMEYDSINFEILKLEDVEHNYIRHGRDQEIVLRRMLPFLPGGDEMPWVVWKP